MLLDCNKEKAVKATELQCPILVLSQSNRVMPQVPMSEQRRHLLLACSIMH